MKNRSKRKREDETKPSGNKGKSTVCFNVGGRIYEVSRSLLDQYPDTMLSRLASDTWSKVQSIDNGDGNEDAVPTGNDGGNKKALFVERNGDRFQYCLDYMRDGGSAVIPLTVSKDALLQDLAYYGFHEVDPSAISVEGSLAMLKTGHQHFESLQKNLNDELSMMDDEILRIERNRRYVKLIKEILLCFKNSLSLKIVIRFLEDDFGLYSTAKELVEGDKNEFIAYLKTVGFKLNKIEYGKCDSTTVVIHLKLL